MGVPEVNKGALLEVRDLSKSYTLQGGLLSSRSSLQALRGVSLSMNRGDTLGLVGESGCGKTTLARCLVKLEHPDSGRISFGGKDLSEMDRGETARFRRRVQMVFQDPWSSLNPRQRVGSIIGEPLQVHHLAKGDQLRRRVGELMEMVGLDKSARRHYPHEFSGGQRQRISIARALALSPDLLVADEAVSALDVSVQAQILGLLRELRRSLSLSILMISHDLAVIRQICDRVAVMYLGEIVESGPPEILFHRPRHPYTSALLEAVPGGGTEGGKGLSLLPGDPPAASAIPPGCPFHPRCPRVEPECSHKVPENMVLPDNSTVRCFRTT
jgi:peptide/nickel transport system ATP-binding protein